MHSVKNELYYKRKKKQKYAPVSSWSFCYSIISSFRASWCKKNKKKNSFLQQLVNYCHFCLKLNFYATIKAGGCESVSSVYLHVFLLHRETQREALSWSIMIRSHIHIDQMLMHSQWVWKLLLLYTVSFMNWMNMWNKRSPGMWWCGSTLVWPLDTNTVI